MWIHKILDIILLVHKMFQALKLLLLEKKLTLERLLQVWLHWPNRKLLNIQKLELSYWNVPNCHHIRMPSDTPLDYQFSIQLLDVTFSSAQFKITRDLD